MAFIYLLIGLVIGVIITTVYQKRNSIGTIRVDYSDPDSSPYLFLEIDHGKSHRLYTSSNISLRVDLTQK